MEKRQIILLWVCSAAVAAALAVWGIFKPPVPLYFIPLPLLVALGLTIPSKTVKYYLIMAAMLGTELLLSYLFYLFAVSNNFLYALFSLILFAGIAFYLVYTRFREKIKIKSREEVLAGYSKTARIIVLGIFIFLGVLVFFKSIAVLITSLR